MKAMIMARQSARIPLKSPSPGSERYLLVHRYGQEGVGKKAYLQASLHADEWPGLIVLHHLIPMLDQAAAEGRIKGEIILLPYANPIGLGQMMGGYLSGRYAFDGSGNFNRNWPNLGKKLVKEQAAALAALADQGADHWVAGVRNLLRTAAKGLSRRTEVEELQAIILGLSIDADLVLDLHCDGEAELHLYANLRHHDRAVTLAAELGAPVVLLEEEAGGDPFDEANASPWWVLQQAAPCYAAMPLGCFSCTVELRGRQDIDDDYALRDAEALFAFLVREGLIEGESLPLTDLPAATRLDAVDVLDAPIAGLVCYQAPLGSYVHKGDVIAEVIDPTAIDPTKGRHALITQTDGLLFARIDQRLVRPGERVAKVAGTSPLDYRQAGTLLAD